MVHGVLVFKFDTVCNIPARRTVPVRDIPVHAVLTLNVPAWPCSPEQGWRHSPEPTGWAPDRRRCTADKGTAHAPYIAEQADFPLFHLFEQ